MRRLLYRVVLTGVMVPACVLFTVWAFRLPEPMHIIALFLGWLAAGHTWQELSDRLAEQPVQYTDQPRPPG